MKRILLSTALLIASVLQMMAAVQPIVLTSPDDWQICAVSQNGKWATGVYVDYSGAGFGFLWNLESNSTQLLSTAYSSFGSSVSNDGVVAGNFIYSGNGVATQVPGYYKDGEWHVVELPSDSSVGDVGATGAGEAITPDGTKMTGCVYIKGSYVPFVWSITDGGTIVKQLDISNPEGKTQHGRTSCISPNGTMVGGWAYRYNRSNVLWDVSSGQKQYVGLTDHAHQGFNAAVAKFSPDGKKVIFAGGWDQSVSEGNNTQYAYSVYDIESGKITLIPTVGGSNATVALYGISADYTVVGANHDFDGGRGVIYKTTDAVYDEARGLYRVEKGEYLDHYLAAQGVDFSKLGMYYNPNISTPTTTLFRGQDISADGNVICALYYANVGGQGVLRSMVVMLNQDRTHAAPQEVKVRQMTGIPAVEVTWKKPVFAVDGIKNFNVYRDGVKIASVDKNTTNLYDKNVAYGTHRYYITSVYDDEETQSLEFSVNVEAPAVQGVQNLFARQRGINSIYAQWESPMSNLINKNWYNAKTANLQDFGIGIGGYGIEMGVGFSKEEIALYEGCKVAKVAFYPMEQRDYTINIYNYGTNGKLNRFYSQKVTQPLVLKERNTVELTQPLTLPADSKVVVAIETFMNQGGAVLGMDYGKCTAEYSDLIRFTDEADFYSYYNLRAQQGYPDFITLMIDMVLEPQSADKNADIVDHYVVCLGDKEVGNTSSQTYIVPDAILTSAAADRQVGIKTVFADGSESDAVTAVVKLQPAFVGASNIVVAKEDDTKVLVTWDAPMDIDRFNVTYSGETAGVTRETGVKGPAANNYGFMAGALYTEKMLKGYQGYEVKKLRFYPLGDATFTFMILENGVQVAEVPVYDYEVGKWNEVELETPLFIKEKSRYTLVLDIYDAEPQVSVLAIDNMVPYTGQGDVYSLDASIEGASWTSIGDVSARGNWMMGMVVEETDPQPAHVSGYDLYISNPGETMVKKVNTSVITDTQYVHDFGKAAEGSGKVRLTTYYEGRATAAHSGVNTDYTIVTAGINNVVADDDDAPVYDIMGRSVKQMNRGLYIKNHKVILKR